MEAATKDFYYYYGEGYQQIDKILSNTGKKLALTCEEVKNDIQSMRTIEDSPVIYLDSGSCQW